MPLGAIKLHPMTFINEKNSLELGSVINQIVFFNMARYRRYTKTVITKKAKKSWNSGAITARYDVETFNRSNAVVTTVLSNSLDNANPAPTVIQAKHIKVYGLICLAGNATEAGPPTPVLVMSYLIYLPQIVYELVQSNASDTGGLYNVCMSVIRDHPEYVMSQKNVNVKFQGGLPGEHDVTKFTQTTGRMKRNLRSGDKLVHILTFTNYTAATSYNRELLFDFQYNTAPN